MVSMADMLNGMDFIDWSDPVNWPHEHNRGLVAWYLAVPGMGWGSLAWRDLCRRRNGTLTGMTATSAWQPGSPTQSIPGSLSLVYSSTQYVAIGDISTLIAGSDSASIVVWCKRRTATPGPTAATGFNLITAGDNEHYPYTDGLGYMKTFRASRRTVTLSSAVDRTQWHQVAITVSTARGWKMYQNLINIDSTTADAYTISSACRLGHGASSYYFDGWYKQALLYNRDIGDSGVRLCYESMLRGHPESLNRIPLRYGQAQAAVGGSILPLFNHYQCAAQA